MKPSCLSWRALVAGLLVVGSVWTGTLAAEDLRGLQRSCQASQSDSQLMSCAPLTTWTMRLAHAQLALYPPGIGDPQLF